MAWLSTHPLGLFLAQLVSIIAVSRLLGLALRRAGQPMVIAEIIAGILLGPSLLGWVWPTFSASVFPASSLGTVQLVSQLGLVLFMFLVGLELDLRLLRGRGHTSVLISHTSIVVPFGLGMWLAHYLYERYIGPEVSFWAFSMFMGAALSITAFPVLARILSERRLNRTRVGAVTIACAAVDDVTAWCILAFVVAVSRATGLTAAIVTTSLAITYVLVMALAVRPLLVRLSARMGRPDEMGQNVVAGVLLLVFTSAWVTELIGIHALFGAFLMGAILPRKGGFARSVAEKLEEVVLVVLLPLFFAYSGLRTDIQLIQAPGDWLACGLIILVACVGKFGGSFLPAYLTGLSWRESAALGVLMNTRGLMELIVLNIGLDLGVITPTIFSMMVVMALFTTVITTPLVAWIYPAHEMALDLVDGHAPAEVVDDAGDGVLVCVADRRSGPGLVSLAASLSSSESSQIHALHLEPPADRSSDRIDAEHQPATRALEPLLERAAELGVDVKALSFVSADPAADICRVAELRGVHLVLLGLHRPLLSQARLGGVVHEVMRDTRASVAVLVERDDAPPKRVLVPYQGGDNDRAALSLARALMPGGASITVLHVVEPGRSDEAGGGAQGLVASVFEEESGYVTLEIVRSSEPLETVVARSRADVDLVVVGIGRVWGLQGRRFSLQTESLLRDCPCSVLVVRGARATPAVD
jgi:Kef-type K+ transport system membrane component KefB/nucleotide-binding universal stress UspA family protein